MVFGKSTVRVSVLVPVRNGEKYLESAIQSILSQTFRDFEIVVVDDGSTDKTPEILAKLSGMDSRVRIVRNPGPHGVANALNLGLNECVGELIARHDADDLALDTRLAKQVNFLDANPEIAIVGTWIELMTEEGEPIRIHGEPVSSAAVTFQSMFGTPFAHPSVMFRREAFVTAGLLYKEVPAQDYELWVRALDAGLVGANLPEVLVRYRVFAASDSHVRAAEHARWANEIADRQLNSLADAPSALLSQDRTKQIAHALICGVPFEFSPGDEVLGDAIFDLADELASSRADGERFGKLRGLLGERWFPVRAKLTTAALLASSSKRAAGVKRAINRYLCFSPFFNRFEPETFIRNVPIIINTRDRVSELKTLVTWLRAAGHERICIIDNASTYPPLREYLDNFDGQVIRHRKNLGHTALWQTPQLSELIKREWFVYTDPDVIPYEGCPLDAVAHFYELLRNYRWAEKAGFGLRLDDLPDHYGMKQQVIDWESQLYKRELKPGVFRADIDTTFALYRPGTGYCYGPAIRTRGLYEARHMPWYSDTQCPTEEDRYYRAHALRTVSTWGIDAAWASVNVDKQGESLC